MSNSVDPDETAHYEHESSLYLRYFQKHIIIAYGVKQLIRMLLYTISGRITLETLQKIENKIKD